MIEQSTIREGVEKYKIIKEKDVIKSTVGSLHVFPCGGGGGKQLLCILICSNFQIVYVLRWPEVPSIILISKKKI